MACNNQVSKKGHRKADSEQGKTLEEEEEEEEASSLVVGEASSLEEEASSFAEVVEGEAFES